MSERTLSVRVWRGGESGHFQHFEVPRLESQTMLYRDVLDAAGVGTWCERKQMQGKPSRLA